MRGKGVFKKWSGNAGGITPAYAGKSSHVLMLLHFLLDHPRLCGEKQLIVFFEFGSEGSPPPMRGKAFSSVTANSFFGITPAYAGKSRMAFRWLSGE